MRLRVWLNENVRLAIAAIRGDGKGPPNIATYGAQPARTAHQLKAALELQGYEVTLAPESDKMVKRDD